jgi:hypothetical protein
LQMVGPDEAENVLNVIARIDDHGFVRGFVPDQGTVALQWANGKDFMNHG